MINIVRLASSGACGRRGESELASIRHVVGMGACARRGVQVSGGFGVKWRLLMVVARDGGGDCRAGPQGADVKRGGYAWVAEVDGVVSRYFSRVARDEMKMGRHSFIGYRSIRTYLCRSIF